MSMSINATSSYVPDTSNCKAVKTPYEQNEATYGPVAAAAIGVAQAAASTASSTVSFSEQALGKMSEYAKDAVDAVGEGVGYIETGAKKLEGMASDGLHKLEDTVESGYQEVKEDVGEAADAVGHAASAVYDGVASVGEKLASYVAIGAQAIREMV